MFRNHIPDTIHQTLLLEALTYRVAINSLFSQNILISYNYLSNIISIWAKSPLVIYNVIRPWRESIWAGIPLELYDIIYKASYLLQGMPLPPETDQISEISSLRQRLKALHLQYPRLPTSSVFEDVEEEQDPRTSWPLVIGPMHKQVHELYLSTASLMLSKLSKPWLQAGDISVRGLFSKALLSMPSAPSHQEISNVFTELHPSPDFVFVSDPESLSITCEISPLMVYPLTILGTAALSVPEREFMTAQIRSLIHISGERAMNSVLRFLSHAWYGDEEEVSVNFNTNRVWEEDDLAVSADQILAKPLGLDIFYQSDMLSSVVL